MVRQRTPSDPPGGVAEDATDPRAGPVDRLLVVGVGAVVLCAVVTVASAAVQGWVPVADQAFIELMVRDVVSDPPLLGVWSRFGWSHPGPAQFYLLWPFYAVAGSSSVGLIAGTVALHTAALAAAVLVARRRSTAAGVMVFLASAVVLWAPGVEVWRDPWNPWVGLVGTALVVVLAWDLAERGRVGAVALLPVASLLVQAHLGNAVVAAVVVVVALASARWSHRSEGAPVPMPWRPLAWGAGVAAVMWVPPILAQLLGRAGRFSEIVTGGAGDAVRAGGRAALGVLTGSFAVVPWWADPGRAGDITVATGLAIPVWLVLPVGGLVVAWRRRDLVLVRAVAVALTAVLAGALGVAVGEVSDDGTVFAHLVVSLRSGAAVSMALGAAALLRAVDPGMRQRALGGLAVAGIVLVALATVLQPWGANPMDRYGPMAAGLSDAVLEAGLGEVPLVWVDPEALGGAEGVFLQLERAGADILVERDDFRLRVGDHRMVDAAGDRVELVVAGIGAEPELRDAGFEVVGRCQTLTPEERSAVLRSIADQSALIERRRALGQDADPAERRRIDRELEASIGSTRALVDGRLEGLVAVRAPEGSGLDLGLGAPREVCG